MPVCHICRKSNLFNKKEIEILRVKESLHDTNWQPHRICMKCMDKFEKLHNIRLTVLGYYPYKSKKFVKLGSGVLVRWKPQIELLKRKEREQRRLSK